MKISKNTWLIHIFAVLHASVCLACNFLNIADDLMLTLLTMFLVLLICLRWRMSPMFVGIAAITVNIAGYFVGMGLAMFFGLFSLHEVIVNPIATFICTELIGWTTELIASRYSARHETSSAAPDSKSMRNLLVVFVAIIVLRLTLIFVQNGADVPRKFLIEMILDYVFSCVIIVWMAEYAVQSREAAEKAAAEANLAYYRYMKLKQQVNPHFLFNSLNSLDYLILEKTPDEASAYTHKLASVYRYLINSEEEKTVPLREEMEFMNSYLDLQKLRFPKGLRVEVDIPEEDLQRSVVPCSVQLLLENAMKHNSVTEENPLVVRIHTTKNSVVVTNNLVPKLTTVQSSGLGLRYLRQQYKDISGKSVIVKPTEDTYTVIIPLI